MAKLLDKIDWEKLGASLEKPIVDGLRIVTSGAEDDLKAFGLRISVHMATALQFENTEERDALMAELYGQLEALAEVNRIRLVGSGWDTAKKILSVVFKAAVATIGAVL